MDDFSRKLPIGIQSFEKLISQNFLYVDKTAYIHMLVHSSTSYFLSRPRRFGKSLLLSTLKAYWEGRKDLFAGLAIETLEKDNPDAWQAHPVFYFDFNGQNYLNTSLEDILNEKLNDWDILYKTDTSGKTLSGRFQTLLKTAKAQTGKNCVVLVDEYDKPLLEVMENPDLEACNKAVFKGCFSMLKSCDESLQFVMITGVTKFSKVSIFSDLNQLEDISLDEDYAGICGITEKELLDRFSPETARMAAEQKLSEDDLLSRLKQIYDGYQFSSAETGVYNPYSLLNALKKRRFGYYWFETGTPTFLVKKLKEMAFDIRRFTDRTLYATERTLSDYRGDNPDLTPLLYQTGYLTIKDFDFQKNYFVLGFPNEEVTYGFLECLAQEYIPSPGTGTGKDILSLRQHIEAGNLDALRDSLTALFAGIPYATHSSTFENYFQAILYIVFTLLGQYVQCEIHSSKGRADCIVETRKFVYLFEFKLDKSAEEALNQINEKGYAVPYAASPKTIFQIGVNFSSESRQLTGWQVAQEK